MKYFILNSKGHETDVDTEKIKWYFNATTMVKDNEIQSNKLQKLFPQKILEVNTETNTIVYHGITDEDLNAYKGKLEEISKRMVSEFGDRSFGFTGIWNKITEIQNMPFKGAYILDGIPYYPVELFEMILAMSSEGDEFVLRETGNIITI